MSTLTDLVEVEALGPDRYRAMIAWPIWFHRAGRCDEWVLVSAVPLSTAGSRGLVLGSVHDRSGRHVASFTQELLIRANPSPAG